MRFSHMPHVVLFDDLIYIYISLSSPSGRYNDESEVDVSTGAVTTGILEQKQPLTSRNSKTGKVIVFSGVDSRSPSPPSTGLPPRSPGMRQTSPERREAASTMAPLSGMVRKEAVKLEVPVRWY